MSISLRLVKGDLVQADGKHRQSQEREGCEEQDQAFIPKKRTHNQKGNCTIGAIIADTLPMTVSNDDEIPGKGMSDSIGDSCNAPLHPRAEDGLRLFNAGEYFEAHEALEDAWNAEPGKVRDLYRGILQIAVVYLHITRRNYNGAVKVYVRSQRWLKDWPQVCRGIEVGKLRRDADIVIQEVRRLGVEAIADFDRSLLKPVEWQAGRARQAHVYICDRCGHEMVEKNCKVTCPNCGNRFDCSDLNIYFD